MADSELSSDLEQTHSPARPKPPAQTSCKDPKKRSKRASSDPKPSSSKGHRATSAEDKAAKCRQEALERHFDQAQYKAQMATQPAETPATMSAPPPSSEPQVPPALPQGDPTGVLLVSQLPTCSHQADLVQLPSSMPAMSSQPALPHSAPEATFTPTAAGLRMVEGPQPFYCDLQAMILATVSRMLATGLPPVVQPPVVQAQGLHPAPVPEAVRPLPPPHGETAPIEYSLTESVHSNDSNFNDDDERGMEFSDDEDALPEKPTFTGLFRPSLFKALLHKAIAATQLASSKVSPKQQGDPNLHEALFAVPKADQEFIPCPQLFTEIVQSPWSQPGSLAAPNGLDKKMFCSAPNLQDLLALPSRLLP